MISHRGCESLHLVSCPHVKTPVNTNLNFLQKYSAVADVFMLIYYPFRHVLTLLVTLSLVLTTYLYLYPFFHGCAFPSADTSLTRAYLDTVKQHIGLNPSAGTTYVPFQLLVLGDPQLEGDSSLPDAGESFLPSLEELRADIITAPSWGARAALIQKRLGISLRDDLTKVFRSYRKRLDLFGNDYYLAHIYRTVSWWSRPTHVAVLGDLIGSQWVTDGEFARRGRRYWDRVFWGGTRVEDKITGHAALEDLGADGKWRRRIINVAGNHDVGYAGDMTWERVERFEQVFGKANWEITFGDVSLRKPVKISSDMDQDIPRLRIVVLNSLNLDTPVLQEDLQRQTYSFINDVITSSRPVEDRKVATILLTHLPLHKEACICVDGPFFDFHAGEYGGGVKEQNHLSPHAGNGILEGIFGMSSNPNAPGGGLGRNGIILTGHDHEGCDVYHHISTAENSEGQLWNTTRWRDAAPLVNQPIPGIREITVRSMMGDFGGNAGLLSAWFDQKIGEWRFEYSTCSIGVQHIWWAIHVLDLVTVCGVMLAGLVSGWRSLCMSPPLAKASHIKREILGQDGKPGNGHDSTTTQHNGELQKEGSVESKLTAQPPNW